VSWLVVSNQYHDAVTMAKQRLTQSLSQRQTLGTLMQRELGMMLEKNGAELADAVSNALKENPALEEKRDEGSDGDGPAEGISNQADERGQETTDTYDNNSDDDPADLGEHRYRGGNTSPDDVWYTPTVVNQPTLYEYLDQQLGELALTDKQLAIADFVIGNIGVNGYLWRKPNEIADDMLIDQGMDVTADEVDEVVRLIQRLDPPGVGALTLRECLLLQLLRKPQRGDTAIATTIIDHHFDDFAHRRLEALCRATGISLVRLHQVIEHEILTLNPRPGNAFTGGEQSVSNEVTPDFEVEVDDGRITLTLPNRIPELQISESYALQNAKYTSGAPLTVTEQKERKFIKDGYERANRFIEVLKMRQQTLFDTMNAIIKFQREYFLSGDERSLHPLVLRQIATAIGKDVATVSRATNNKYVATPWGIRSLRSFFSEGIKRKDEVGGDEDQEASAHEVRAALRDLINHEDKAHPLSDDALCKRLGEQGYQMARRTVAKYRERMGIARAGMRRQKTIGSQPTQVD